jgi:hypothetical protein
MMAAAIRCLEPESVLFAGLECGGLPPLSWAHQERANEGSAKNPPKGKLVEGVFYIAAKAATHKATPSSLRTVTGSAKEKIKRAGGTPFDCAEDKPALPFAKRLWVNSFGMREKTTVGLKSGVGRMR